MFLGLVIFLLIGGLLATQPEKMMRWTIRGHPEFADNRVIMVLTRVIGIGFIGMSLLGAVGVWMAGK